VNQPGHSVARRYREGESTEGVSLLSHGGANVYVRNTKACRTVDFLLVMYSLLFLVNYPCTLAVLSAYSGNVQYVVIRSLPSLSFAQTQISQVVVMAGGVNVALNKRCTSNADYLTDSCNFIIDGIIGSWHYYLSSYELSDWVTINLQDEYLVTSVIFYNGGVSLMILLSNSPNMTRFGFRIS
jgi:hypothetical protein